VNDSVSLREGTTLNILTRNSDVVTLHAEGTKGKGLGGAHVNVLALVDGLGTVVKNTLQVAVNIESVWGSSNLLANVLQSIGLDSSGEMREDLGGELLGTLESVPGAGKPFLGSRLVVLAAGKGLLEHTPNPLLVLLDVILSEGLVLDKLVDVLFKGRLLLVDALVHQRLGEGGLVGLIVTLLTVANDVNDNILLELGTPVGSELADKVDGLDIVTVDVEDGGVNGLGNVGTVGSRAGETGIGGETDLVVDDNVDGTTSLVRGKSVETHGFVDNTLTSESGVTVEQDTHGGVGLLLVTVVVQNGSGLSENDGVFGFQMRRVGDERKLHTLTGRSRALEVHTKMVLDITGSFIGGLGGTGKLTEDGLVGLADDVGKDIETTTVRHANDNILDTIINTAIDQSLHSGNEGFTTLETETLVVGVLCGEEALKAGTPDQTVQNASLLIDRVLVGLRNLDTGTEPVALLTVGNVNVLDTVTTTVETLASGNNVLELHLVLAFGSKARQDTGAKAEFLLHVGLGEVVVVKVELGRVAVAKLAGLVADTERIDLGLVVASGLVCAYQELDLEMVGQVGAVTNACSGGGRKSRSSTLGGGYDGRRGLEGLRDGHVTLLHVAEVDLP